MADRYFIGGLGAKDWNDTDNWSASSGGVGGASVPTSSDNVYFDALSLSDTCTLTLDAEANCLDLDMTGLDQTLALTSSVYTLNVYGSLTLNSNLTVTFTGTAYLYFKATTSETITSNSATQSWNRLYFDGVGGKWTNQDDWVANMEIYLQNGTLDTNSKEIDTVRVVFGGYTGIIYIDGTGNKSLICGSSNIYTSCIRELNSGKTNFIGDFGTSYIKIQLQGSKLIEDQSFYNVEYCGISNHHTSSKMLIGNNSFVNLTLSSGHYRRCEFDLYGDIEVSNLLTVEGINHYQRLNIISTNSSGINAKSVSVTDCNFGGIIATGDADWDFSALEIGDCGGNSGITFRTGENRYYYEGTGNFHDAKWYSASGGGGVAKGMPLPQDTAIFDANSFSGSATLTIANARIGNIDMSEVDEAVLLEVSNYVECYGDFILKENITRTGIGGFYFYGIGIHDIIAPDYLFYAFRMYRGSYSIKSNIDVSNDVLIDQAITKFDLNDYNFTCRRFYGTGVGSNLYLGDGILTFINSNAGNFTWDGNQVNYEGSTIVLAPSSGTGNIVFDTNNKTFNNLWVSPTGTFTGTYAIIGGGVFNDLKIDAGCTVKFGAGRTIIINSLTATGTAEKPITITSATAAQHTLTKSGEGKVFIDNCDISYSNVDANKFIALNSTDSGNNTNWIFSKLNKIANTNYIKVNKIAGVSRNKIKKIMEVR